MAKSLSPAKCTLLTIHYASEGNIKALNSFTPSRHDNLKADLILRILLTYLPESIEPREYATYINKVASGDADCEDVEVDISPVKDIDEEKAKKRVKKLKLLDIKPSSYPLYAPEDVLTQFLLHRAYRIDSETGLLNLIPQLVEPFTGHNEYLRTWYIGVVLPLLRYQFEYYPENEQDGMRLTEFDALDGRACVDFLMSTHMHSDKAEVNYKSEVARDIRGLVGPWMYGHTERKRRKLGHERSSGSSAGKDEVLESRFGKTSLSGVSTEGETNHPWEHIYTWMVSQSCHNFPVVTQAIEDWDGPSDVDLGGFNTGRSDRYMDEDTQSKLESQYAQAAFASCYAVQANTEQTVRDAHSVLARLSRLLDFTPPPDLATSVDALPKIERNATQLEKSQSTLDMEPETLLRPDHPLTTPTLETYMLLQMMVYSAYQFLSLSYPISLANVAKLHFAASSEEQLSALQKILRGLSKGGAKRDEALWNADRAKLLWLWKCDIDIDDQEAVNGAGVLGKIPRAKFEEEMLRCFIDTSCYDFAIKLYLKPSNRLLSHERIEQVVLMQSMEAYDGASNGNRTRGGMKKANDILTAFRPYFPHSIRFRQATALISATHSLSFYSLTLQHGVPFQPVSIRVVQDPIGLISKVLEQNSASYTQLDDLVNIGQNFVSAGLPSKDVLTEITEIEDELESKRKNAGRRVTFMAIEAALREDDFETAYSYIVSRLTPSGNDIEVPKDTAQTKRHTRNVSKSSTQSSATEADDDISWRAAFLAGRYRSRSSSPPSLRRLEQRTELLSLALLLAPVSALTEILAAWRRCEEEMTALQMSQQQAEEEFDDQADKRGSINSIPGNFTVQGEQPALVYNQKRREMGRMTGTAGGDNAPVSMFDLTRSAAQAISRNAFPLRASGRTSSGHETNTMESSVDSLGSDPGTEGQQRVRKRDMVANAVSGGLASGLGWVLGATPVHQQPTERRDDQ